VDINKWLLLLIGKTLLVAFVNFKNTGFQEAQSFISPIIRDQSSNFSGNTLVNFFCGLQKETQNYFKIQQVPAVEIFKELGIFV